MKIRFVLSIGAIAAIAAGCANNPLGESTTQPAAARDYQELSGTWQLTRAVVNGRAVPASQLRKTILITDGNTFRFPKASGQRSSRLLQEAAGFFSTGRKMGRYLLIKDSRIRLVSDKLLINSRKRSDLEFAPR